jgi:hypothetical protein
MDLQAGYPASFSSRAVDVAPGKATPRLAWTTTGSGASLDAAIGHVTWTSGSQAYDWYIAMPVSIASPVQFPDLPDELAAGRVSSSTLFNGPQLYFYAGNLFGDTAMYRAHWWDAIEAPLWPPPRDYVARVSAVY